MVKSVYPPPPPTRNDLTPHQRSQLLRSTRKLGKILGTTPRLVDTNGLSKPILVDLPLGPAAFEDKTRFLDSTESLALSSVSSSTETPATPSSSHDPAPPSVRTEDPYELEELWPALKQPPLHISVSRPAPSARDQGGKPSQFSGHTRSSSLDGFTSTENEQENTHMIPYFTYSAPSPAEARDSILRSLAPPMTETSLLDNSFRRQKMDRVTRTLGERVPWRLVFPPASQDEHWWKRSESVRSSFSIPRVPVPPISEVDEEEEDVVRGDDQGISESMRARKVLSIIIE